MDRCAEPVETADFARAAAALLSAEVWDFLAGGSGAETALAANRTAQDPAQVLRMLKTELHDARGLAGCPDVAAVRQLRTVRA